MLKYVLFFITVMIISFVLYLMTYLGVWKDVELSTINQTALKTVYVEHIGPYHKISKQLAKVEAYMASLNRPCGRTYGQYFDDPQFVEEARLKSFVGCVIEGEVPPLVEGLIVGEVPKGEYVQAVFTGSPGIGPLKVYPKVNDYMEKNNLKQNGALIEIYEIHSIQEKNAMTTTYLFPVVAK